MIGLLLTLIIGFGIAYFSRHVSTDITFSVGKYVYPNIPLFFITVGTYILGILLAWIIEIPQSIATTFHIMGLGRKVKSGNTTITELQNKIEKLELEIRTLHQRDKFDFSNKQSDPTYKSNRLRNFLQKHNLTK